MEGQNYDATLVVPTSPSRKRYSINFINTDLLLYKFIRWPMPYCMTNEKFATTFFLRNQLKRTK